VELFLGCAKKAAEMNAVIAVTEDIALLVIAGLPAIVAFLRGAGALRWLALLCSLLSLWLFVLVSASHNLLDGVSGWVLLVATWIVAWSCAVLAIAKAREKL
jgi:hypothetical protein